MAIFKNKISMKTKHLLLVLLSFFIVEKTFSQDPVGIIKGNWVLVDLNNSNNDKLSYIKLEFSDKNICFQSTSPFEKGNEFKYSIIDSVLKMNITEFQISEINENKLVLIDLYDRKSTYTYVRPKLKENHESIYQLDTITILFTKFVRTNESRVIPGYQYSFRDYENREVIFPKFLGEEVFSMFLLHEITYLSKFFKNENRRILNVSFEIIETGEITSITVIDKNNDSWLIKKITKAFQSRNNKWKAVSDKGISYKSKVSFPLVLELRTVKR